MTLPPNAAPAPSSPLPSDPMPAAADLAAAAAPRTRPAVAAERRRHPQPLALLGPSPAWLSDLAPDKRTNMWVRRVCVAVGLDDTGRSLAPALAAMAEAFAVHAAAEAWPDLRDAARTLATVADRAAATTRHAQLTLLVDPHLQPVSHAIVRTCPASQMAAPHARPAQIAQSILVLDAMREGVRASRSAVGRSARMGAAQRNASRPKDAVDWHELARLAPFSCDDLTKYITERAPSQATEVARALLAAQMSPGTVPMPMTSAPVALAPPPSADAGCSTDSPVLGKQATANKTQRERPAGAEPPSVTAAVCAASYAGMAEVFGVCPVLDRLSPPALARVTQACHEALGGEDETLADYALLLTLALIVRRDLDSTLLLRLAPMHGVTVWYDRRDGCVHYDRRALTKAQVGAEQPDWATIYAPPEAIDRIETLVARRTSPPQTLGELFEGCDLSRLIRGTDAWAKRHSDPAHPAWPGRIAHSLGQAYIDAGASAVEAAALTMDFARQPDSTANYYTVHPNRAHALATATLRGLGYEAPAMASHTHDRPSTVAPTDDDMRREWAAIRQVVRSALDGFAGLDVAGVARATTAAMASLRRGYELLTGSRSRSRENPRLRDVLVSRDWVYQTDKRTDIPSDRLLPMTDELADLIRCVRLVRQATAKRLTELGIDRHHLSTYLTAPRPSQSVFIALTLDTKKKLRVSVRPLDMSDMQDVPQLWSGPTNMGRRYWVREASLSSEWLSERLVTGHARGLNHIGSACLSVAVIDLLRGFRRMTLATLSRLQLPRLTADICTPLAPIDIDVDLRRYQRQSHRGSVAQDVPRHHCDNTTLGAWHIVDTLRIHVGSACRLSSSCRALLGLIIVDGLCHTADVEAAWACLPTLSRSFGAAWLRWTRPSGQPIAMPLQPSTRLAVDETHTWPPLRHAEEELAGWLRELPRTASAVSVRWPDDPHAAVTALCAVAGHWVRLHVAPFLVDAYRPVTLAATITHASLDQVVSPTLSPIEHSVRSFDRLSARMRTSTDRHSDLGQLRRKLGSVVKSTKKNGEHRRRVKEALNLMAAAGEDAGSPTALLRAQAEVFLVYVAPVFSPSLLSGAASMMLQWSRSECEKTYRRKKDALDPGTIYDYFNRVIVRLQVYWPVELKATAISSAQWREMGQHILSRSSRDTDALVENRRIAWQRITKTLSSSPLYANALAAFADASAVALERRYVHSAASTVVTMRHVEHMRHFIDVVFVDAPLARAQANAMTDLLTDPGLRRAEACAARINDLAADGQCLMKRGNGFDILKTRRAAGPVTLGPLSAARLLELKSTLTSLHPPRTHLFAERDGDVDLRHALLIYDTLVDLTRAIAGVDVDGHSHRGSAAMRRLVPSWEVVARQLATGPFEIVDARKIVEDMRGAGPAHLAGVLSGMGHASHRTFVRRYCTAWPIFYAAFMRVTLADIPLDASLIRAMPHLRTGNEAETSSAIKRALLRRRAFTFATPDGEPQDDWAWSVRHHYDGWTRTRRPQPAATSPPRLAALASTVETESSLTPMREVEIRHVVLRFLGLSFDAALDATGLGLREGARLEQVHAAMPSMCKLYGTLRPRELKPKFRTFVLRRLDSPAGRALVASISRTDAEILQALIGQMQDHRDAPVVTRVGLGAILDVPPPGFAVEVATRHTHPSDVVASAAADQPRMRHVDLRKRKAARPRVRIVPDTPGHTAHNHAKALTLITWLSAAAMHILTTQQTKK